MKTIGIIGAGLLVTIAGMADNIVSTGTLVNVPVNFQSTTGSGTPFWNNNSVDGLNMNVGDFLTGSNPSMGSTNYMGSGYGTYLSASGGSGPSFTFQQVGTSLFAQLLFSESSANYPFSYLGMSGTSIGLYDVDDPNQKETLFSAGTLYNPADPNGVYKAPQAQIEVGSWARYGIYAYTCGLNNPGNAYCAMYYSDPSLNFNNSLNQPMDTNHQHFSLFVDPKDPETYYIGFEDNRGFSATEGAGDYNDAIFRLITDDPPVTNLDFNGATNPVPEPATFSVLGLGLITLGLFRRRAGVRQ